MSSTSIIQELINCLQWYVDEDEVNRGDSSEFGGVNWEKKNTYWITGQERAIAAISRARAIVDEQPSVVESEELNPWKGELIDALVCNHILEKKHYSDPRKALSDLIDWEVKVATDPRVSDKALKKPRRLDTELPREDDCDGFGRCWFISSFGGGRWSLEDRTSGINGRFYTHFLPYWALPLP